MNNTQKTIEISSIPTPERLSIARQFDANGHAEFMGFRVVNNQSAAVKAEALANASPTYRLTQARMAAAPKKPEQTTPTAGRGAQMVYDDAGKILGFYPGEPA